MSIVSVTYGWSYGTLTGRYSVLQVPCAVLRDSGDVVTMECVEKLIKPDMTNPITGAKLRDKDIIAMQRVGIAIAIRYLLLCRTLVD